MCSSRVLWMVNRSSLLSEFYLETVPPVYGFPLRDKPHIALHCSAELAWCLFDQTTQSCIKKETPRRYRDLKIQKEHGDDSKTTRTPLDIVFFHTKPSIPHATCASRKIKEKAVFQRSEKWRLPLLPSFWSILFQLRVRRLKFWCRLTSTPEAQSSKKTPKELKGFYCGRGWRSRVSSRVLQGERRMEEMMDSSTEESWSSRGNVFVYRLTEGIHRRRIPGENVYRTVYNQLCKFENSRCGRMFKGSKISLRQNKND